MKYERCRKGSLSGLSLLSLQTGRPASLTFATCRLKAIEKQGAPLMAT